VVSTPEERLCRLAQEAADAQDALRALETLEELRRELEAFTRIRVTRALGAGRSFGDVARAQGISRQAAHRRYRELARIQGSQVTADESVRRLLGLAREEALFSMATELGSEHVLLAALRCGGETARALEREGVTLASARACERALATAPDGASRRGATPSDLREVLREAALYAISQGERRLDEEALLRAALAHPGGGARRLLRALGVDATALLGRLTHEQAGGIPTPSINGDGWRVPSHEA